VADKINSERLAGAWSTAVSLRQRLAATAASIAETEDWIADTLDRLACIRPHDAERLHARAAHARMFADLPLLRGHLPPQPAAARGSSGDPAAARMIMLAVRRRWRRLMAGNSPLRG